MDKTRCQQLHGRVLAQGPSKYDAEIKEGLTPKARRAALRKCYERDRPKRNRSKSSKASVASGEEAVQVGGEIVAVNASKKPRGQVSRQGPSKYDSEIDASLLGKDRRNALQKFYTRDRMPRAKKQAEGEEGPELALAARSLEEDECNAPGPPLMSSGDEFETEPKNVSRGQLVLASPVPANLGAVDRADNRDMGRGGASLLSRPSYELCPESFDPSNLPFCLTWENMGKLMAYMDLTEAEARSILKEFVNPDWIDPLADPD